MTDNREEQRQPAVTRRKFLQRSAMMGLVAAVPASFLAVGSAMAQDEGTGSSKAPKLADGTIVDVPGVKVGQVTNEEGLTGCTVIVLEKGSACGVDVRGSAPGTRETDLLNPIHAVQEVNAVVLTGGSAYGLDAASGVMRYMEEQGQGYNVGVGVVPIIPAAVIFDLSIGSAKSVRINRWAMKRLAWPVNNRSNRAMSEQGQERQLAKWLG